jgi:hypothetical protein
MSELERHAIRWRMRGFPVFGQPDEDGHAEPVGVVDAPLKAFSDLTPFEQNTLGQVFFRYLDERDRRGRTASDARVYAAMLDDYGVACPHPKQWRTHRFTGGFVQGYECGACGASIVPIADLPVVDMNAFNPDARDPE